MKQISDCTPDLLRSLFLFESLSQERLDYLCERGSIVSVEPGWLYRQGDDSTCFYCLLEGSLVMYRRVGEDDVETGRTSYRGAYAGAWTAYLGDLVPQVYDASVRVTEPSTFFQMDAAVLREVMLEWFPMAQHLLSGLFQGFTSRRRTVAQRERLLALGSLRRTHPRAEQPCRGSRARYLDAPTARVQEAGEARHPCRRPSRPGRTRNADQVPGRGCAARCRGTGVGRPGIGRPRGRTHRLARGPRRRSTPPGRPDVRAGRYRRRLARAGRPTRPHRSPSRVRSRGSTTPSTPSC